MSFKKNEGKSSGRPRNYAEINGRIALARRKMHFRDVALNTLTFDDKYIAAVLKNPGIRYIPDHRHAEFRDILQEEIRKRNVVRTPTVQAPQERRPDLG